MKNGCRIEPYAARRGETGDDPALTNEFTARDRGRGAVRRRIASALDLRDAARNNKKLMVPLDVANELFDPLDCKAMLQVAEDADPSSALFRRCCERLSGILEKPRPSPAGKKQRRLLTIGMATANDFDGVFFTTESIRLYHSEILNDIEFLAIDNDPAGPCAKHLQEMAEWSANFRYIPQSAWQGTAARDLVFREAAGEFVLCIDCHVLFTPGSLARFVNYCRQHPDSRDLLHGPLIGDDLKPAATHFDPRWSNGMYGCWGLDERGKDPDELPFEIGMQGLGVFGCRREAWPGFNPRLAGFGGEEGYIHEKIRRAGGRNLCLPFLRWMHRFNRPTGPGYQVDWGDRIRNYSLIYDELGLDQAPMIAHFEELLGKDGAAPLVRKAQAELTGPFHFIDGIYCINPDRQPERWEAMRMRFRELGIERKVRRFSAADTHANPHIGRMLSHRRILAEARLQDMNMVVVFEDDGWFPPDAAARLERSLAELKSEDWQIWYLDGPAIAYRRPVYDALLNAIPDDAVSVARFVASLPESCTDTMPHALRLLGVGFEE